MLHTCLVRLTEVDHRSVSRRRSVRICNHSDRVLRSTINTARDGQAASQVISTACQQNGLACAYKLHCSCDVHRILFGSFTLRSSFGCYIDVLVTKYVVSYGEFIASYIVILQEHVAALSADLIISIRSHGPCEGVLTIVQRDREVKLGVLFCNTLIVRYIRTVCCSNGHITGHITEELQIIIRRVSIRCTCDAVGRIDQTSYSLLCRSILGSICYSQLNVTESYHCVSCCEETNIQIVGIHLHQGTVLAIVRNLTVFIASGILAILIKVFLIIIHLGLEFFPICIIICDLVTGIVSLQREVEIYNLIILITYKCFRIRTITNNVKCTGTVRLTTGILQGAGGCGEIGRACRTGPTCGNARSCKCTNTQLHRGICSHL